MQRALRAGWPCAWPMVSSLGGCDRGKAPDAPTRASLNDAMVTSEYANGKACDCRLILATSQPEHHWRGRNRTPRNTVYLQRTLATPMVTIMRGTVVAGIAAAF